MMIMARCERVWVNGEMETRMPTLPGRRKAFRVSNLREIKMEVSQRGGVVELETEGGWKYYVRGAGELDCGPFSREGLIEWWNKEVRKVT